MGVVIGRAQHLAAGQILENRGHPALDPHRRGFHRLGVGEAGQGGAIGAQQERGLDQVALRLLDRQRGEFTVVQRPLGHHPVDRATELLLDLGDGERRHGGIAPAFLGEPGMGVVDRPLAAFDCDIGHAQASLTMTLRGSAVSWSPAHRIRSMPRGNSAWLRCQIAAKSAGRPSIADPAGFPQPRALQHEAAGRWSAKPPAG